MAPNIFIAHMLFVDDVLILCTDSVRDAKTLRGIVEMFSKDMGMEIRNIRIYQCKYSDYKELKLCRYNLINIIHLCRRNWKTKVHVPGASHHYFQKRSTLDSSP